MALLLAACAAGAPQACTWLSACAPQVSTQSESPSVADWTTMTEAVTGGKYGLLLPFDQLRREIDAGRAFAGFQEAPIAFPCTFKVRVPGLFARAQGAELRGGRGGRVSEHPRSY